MPDNTPTTGAAAQHHLHQSDITQVLVRHSRGLDRCDAPLLASCYWPEATVDYGSYKGPAADFATLVVDVLRQQYRSTRHQLHNTAFEISGESARTETLVDARHLSASGDEELAFNGRYLDTLQQRDGEWRLLHRQVVADWARRIPVEDVRDVPEFDDLAKGSNGAADPGRVHLSTGTSQANT
jgi:hypothetical protein